MTNKIKQQGFTIVELLIVIVVIGILAALVITTFTGIQQQARDTERQTDINAIHSQLEAYYAQNGYYPGDAEITVGNLQGLDPEALIAPGGNTAPGTAASTTTQYHYNAMPDACAIATTDCTSYTLNATLEAGGTHDKNSLN